MRSSSSVIVVISSGASRVQRSTGRESAASQAALGGPIAVVEEGALISVGFSGLAYLVAYLTLGSLIFRRREI